MVDVDFFYCKRKGKKVYVLSSLYAPVCVPMVFGDQLPGSSLCFLYNDIRCVIFLSWRAVRQLFPGTFHQERSNQPDKQPHTEALHGSPGILYTC